MDYLSLKVLHILGSVFLFGTGIGLAFYLHVARRSGDADIIRLMSLNAIRADFIFTLPGFVVVLVSGVLMFQRSNLSYGSAWFIAVCGLFLLFSLLWMRGLLKMWQLKSRIQRIKRGSPLASGVESTVRQRCLSDVFAFSALFLVFVLMTYKPWYGICVLGCN